jgi:mannose-6-phosphate isomerase-like protein (cupin superfamily)
VGVLVGFMAVGQGVADGTSVNGVSDQVREPIKGDGYAVASLDGLGDGYGFRKIRRELGVNEMGVNAIVLPGDLETGFHFHDEQEELYFVHAGQIEIEFGDGKRFALGPGGMARVDAATHRKIRNLGSDDAVYLVVGAKGGYVGRDGRQPEGEERVTPPN